MRPLTADMAKRELRPYFLWDEDVSIHELHQILAGPDGLRRDQLLAKMLREVGSSSDLTVSPAGPGARLTSPATAAKC